MVSAQVDWTFPLCSRVDPGLCPEEAFFPVPDGTWWRFFFVTGDPEVTPQLVGVHGLG